MSATKAKRLIVSLLSISFVIAHLPAAQARIIGTESAIEAQQREQRIERVSALLAREDVRAQLVEMGVDPETAQERVASLTDSELRMLDQHIEKLPAGGSDVLIIVGAVFVVLLVLELIGVTNFFTSL
ncbi:MAG: PA2779 family protein [Gammaproteobacteria bacterium]|nr:PA2779 family protein [Gammaproteobacteria bacterium]NIR81774.1 PA2779 family protein [Gammaproteobacteria bacterium]NIR88577.1 PA2779 family protein [Gammaproteobacteria bacterium]NIU02881.1 PA2779 family protein [Gammaproteobacteria bacterium]NIV50403.1 PA2779 family protein [Gammaproteobacteria bacterium]